MNGKSKKDEEKERKRKMLESVVIDATNDIQWNRSAVYYNEGSIGHQHVQAQLEQQRAKEDEEQKIAFEVWQKQQWKIWQDMQKARAARASNLKNKSSVRDIVYPPDVISDARTALIEYQRHACKILERYLDGALLFDESIDTKESGRTEETPKDEAENGKEDWEINLDMFEGFRLFASSDMKKTRAEAKRNQEDLRKQRKRKRARSSSSDEEEEQKKLAMLQAVVIDVKPTKWVVPVEAIEEKEKPKKKRKKKKNKQASERENDKGKEEEKEKGKEKEKNEMKKKKKGVKRKSGGAEVEDNGKDNEAEGAEKAKKKRKVLLSDKAVDTSTKVKEAKKKVKAKRKEKRND